MPRYSEEFKDSIIQEMMPSNNVSASQLVRTTGVSGLTLYNWLKTALPQEISVPGDGKNPDQWNPTNQLAMVTATATFNETTLAEYCRKKVCFLNKSSNGRTLLSIAIQPNRDHRSSCPMNEKKTEMTIKNLKRELRRKDKALAKATALLVLTTKIQKI